MHMHQVSLHHAQLCWGFPCVVSNSNDSVRWKAEGPVMVSPEVILPSGLEGVLYLILLGFLLSKEE